MKTKFGSTVSDNVSPSVSVSGSATDLDRFEASNQLFANTFVSNSALSDEGLSSVCE